MELLAHDPDSRQYVLGRLDREHITTLAERGKAVLATGQAVELCYQPGDATWYSLIIAPVSQLRGAGGGGTSGFMPTSYIGVHNEDAYVIVYAQREEAHWCCPEDDMEWLASKFDVSEASQLAIAELLKAVFDSRPLRKETHEHSDGRSARSSDRARQGVA